MRYRLLVPCIALLTFAPAVGAQTTAHADRPYFEFQVEKQVQTVPGSPMPQYPAALRSSEMPGQVLAQFIVDTTGRYVPGSFKALKTTGEPFTAAVRDVLPKMRFYPAEVGGHKVSQLVQQPFTFVAH